MAIAHVATVTGTAGTSSGSVASGSVTNTAGHVYVLSVSWRRAGAAPTISSVAGMGLTWGLWTTQCGARDQLYHAMYTAVGDGGASGAVTVTFSGNTNGAALSVSSYSGVDLGFNGAGESYNTLGSTGACTGGTDDDDATGTITTTADNSYVVASFATRNRTMTDTSTWTVRTGDLAGGAGGDIQTLSVEDKLIAAAGSATCGGADNLSGTADWSLIAIELQELVATTAVPNAMMMMGAGS